MAFFDVSLKLGTDNRHHFEIDENGDLKHDESFDSFINVSLFSDRRANESEMQQPEKRRGWEGDEFLNLNDYLIGSKLWLLEQSRNTIENRNKAVQIVQEALDWFVQVGYCERVEVSGRRILPSELEITSDFYVQNNLIKSFTFNVWEKTNVN
jgi:phage gp46-like protein